MYKLSREQVANILRLREQGFAYREIIAQTGLSYSSVQTYCHKYRIELQNIARHRTSQEVIDQITKRRRMGHSIPKITRDLGVAYMLVFETCRKYCPGLNKIGFRKIDHRKYEVIERHYKDGYTTKQLSKMAGVHQCTVQRYLKSKGVELPLTVYRNGTDRKKNKSKSYNSLDIDYLQEEV